MTESPQLLANVEFETVKKGGYDPEQVDNYLHLLAERVGMLQQTARNAVEQAELAQARLAEAERAKATALATAEQAKADLEAFRNDHPGEVADGDVESTESLKKMLLLAQRTADTHVEEAQASAKNIVADARTKAAEIVAGAETRAERLLIEAQKVADEMVQERTGQLNEVVAQLEVRRNGLQADVDALSRYVDEHRRRVQDVADALASLLDDPTTFRAEPVPDMQAPASAATAVTPAPTVDVRTLGTETTAVPTRPSVPARAATAGDAEAPRTAAPTPEAKSDPTSPTATPGSATTVRVDASGSTATVTRDPEADFPAVKIPELLEAPEGVAARMEAAGPATQELSVIEQESLLAEGDTDADGLDAPDETTDEAMRRFFDEDPDEADDRKGIFRRK